MDVTAVLAVVGAASGVAGIGLSALTYRRNRPIIVVPSHTVSDVRQQWFVQVDVRNEGQQGVTLTDIGLAVRLAPAACTDCSGVSPLPLAAIGFIASPAAACDTATSP